MIGLRGIDLKTISIKETTEAREIEGTYSLMSTENKELAQQSFNGYSSIKIEMSSDTNTHLKNLISSLKKDIEVTLGFDTK